MTLLNTELASPNERSQADSIIEKLVAQLSEDRFDLWFGNRSCLVVQQQSVQISAESEFAAIRLQKKFGTVVRKVVDHVCGPHFGLEFQADPGFENQESFNAESEVQVTPDVTKVHPSHSPTPTPMGFAAKRKKPGIDSFYFGDANQLAQAGVKHVLSQPGQMSPFYIFGPSGCGKSHLLECLTNQVRRVHRCRAVFLSAEQFTSYFVQALRGSGLPMFRRKYRDLDLLAIDDIQFFAGKKATLSEVQYTIDNLIRAGKQVVIAADRPPIELDQINADLAARLTSGLTCPLNYPGFEQRLMIAQNFCSDRQLAIPDSVLELVCERLSKDVRKLSGAMNLLHAAHVATGNRIDTEMAERVLADLYTISNSNTSMGKIEKVVCQFCGVKPADLKSPSRKKKICTARMLAMYLSREHTSSAFSEIGDYFGGRSHSTVIAAQQKVNGWLKNDRNIDLPRATYPAKEVLRRIESNLRIG